MKHLKMKTEARSTKHKARSTKHPNLENEAPIENEGPKSQKQSTQKLKNEDP